MKHVLFAAVLGIAVLPLGCDDDPVSSNADATSTSPNDATTGDSSLIPEDADPEVFALYAVTPNEGSTAGLQEVRLVGTSLGDVTQVLFGDAGGVDVFVVSPTLIVCMSPPQPRGLVDVTVIDKTGRRATLSKGFNYRDPVQVTAVEPPQGHWLGGEPITVYGAGFTEGSVVLVGGRPALSVEFVDAGTITAVTPDGVPGRVDVHVSSLDGVGRLRNGFEYTGAELPPASATINSVSPNHGPVTGNTEIQISGNGFAPGATVRIGAMNATGVHVADNLITAKTPAGTPGSVAVRVIQNGQMVEKVNTFTYEGEPALWAVNPPTGSVAGGTSVTVLGTGFPTSGGVDVYFGTEKARDVDVESDGVIHAVTPPGDVGLAPVRVVKGELSIEHPRGFVYFDPAAQPGTWGEPIDGNLNVTVVDANSGVRVEGAFVLVGDSLQTQYRGYTDINGQITFSGPDLIGDQVVSASRQGYQIFQLGGFDAENVTLAAERIPECSDLSDIPCDVLTQPGQSATLFATIVGSDKAPTIPYGDCDDWADLTSGLCAPCSVDDDCVAVIGGGGPVGEGVDGLSGQARCAELGGQGSYCTVGCQQDSDCSDGFVCFDPNGLDKDRRCLPPPGVWTAFCDITETDMYADQFIAYPGIPVAADHTVEMAVHLGDFALFCWGGTSVRGEFEPQYLGIVRQLGAYEDGDIIETELKLDIPIDEKVVVEVERPTLGPVNEERTLLRTIMNLGGDGVLEFPPLRAFNARHFEMKVPGQLDGQIYDATWDLYVEVSVPPLNGGSAALETGLHDLNPLVDYQLDGDTGTWEAIPGFDQTILEMAVVHGASGGGDGTEALLAVGEGGLVARSFNGSWARQQSGTDRDLHALAVAPARDVDGVERALLGGKGGYSASWDGLRWTPQTTNVVGTIEGIAFADAVNAWAVAGRQVLKWDGSAWTVAYTASKALHAVAADATTMWAVGDEGLVVTGGDSFVEQTLANGHRLDAIWRSASGKRVAVGEAGAILLDDGSGWQLASSGSTADLFTVWGRSDDDFWVAGQYANIMHWDGTRWVDQTPLATRSTVRSLAGVAGGDVLAFGSHELVLGPLLGIPEGLDPAPNSVLSGSLSWTARPSAEPDFTVLDIGSQVGPCAACGFMFMLPYGEWRTVIDGDLYHASFPEFGSVGALGLGWGVKSVSITRARVAQPFDFDHTAGTGFFGGAWKQWSWRTESWFR